MARQPLYTTIIMHVHQSLSTSDTHCTVTLLISLTADLYTVFFLPKTPVSSAIRTTMRCIAANSWPRHKNYNIILRMITVRIIKGIIIPLLLLLSIIHMHFKCIPDRIWIPRIYFALLLLLFTLYYVHCIDFQYFEFS